MILRQNFKRGLVKAVLEVTEEDEAILTLNVKQEAEERVRNRYEKECAESKDMVLDPDKYADEQIKTDKKEAEYSARDWAIEMLELRNLKKRIRIVWSKE